MSLSCTNAFVFHGSGHETDQGRLLQIFFCSYVIVISLVLMNVVVAVLLEGFLGAIGQMESDERQARSVRQQGRAI